MENKGSLSDEKTEDELVKTVEKSSAEANKENLNEGKDLDTLLHHLYIAHELAVDESRNVWMQNQPEDISNENIIKVTLREAYWDLFREQISEDPPKLDMAFDILAEIKKGLELVMTPNITTLRKQVAEVLDLDLLRTQAEHDAVDVMYYAKYITSVISKICAPVRDKTVAQLSKETDIVAIFRGIVEILSLMKYDLLSFSLAAIKPDIMANHLAYERDTFREYINAIGGALPRTTKWLSKHLNASLSTEDIVYNAYIDMLTWDDAEPYPETLFLEEERLRRLKLDYFRLSVSCTLLFLSLGLIPQSLHKDDFKESIKSFIMILMVEAKNDADVKKFCSNIAIHLCEKVKNSVQTDDTSSNAAAELNYKVLQESVEPASLPDNKIRTLVCTRVNDYLKCSLKVTNNPELNFPPALNLFKFELTALRHSFQSIFKHNMLVCMEHYQKLVNTDSLSS
ncbi:T-complex protein 11-like protein 1 [Rhodnius prolixus]|uniref:T-complex protein 11-like protein 1 n=1 Tax=Rhodnius prolixus TaxID=13249 RepID=UPI003D18C72C